MQTADCRPRVKCRLEVKLNIINDKIRITDKDLRVFVHVPVIFSEIPKPQTKKHFLALVKHYIINRESLNSPFNL